MLSWEIDSRGQSTLETVIAAGIAVGVCVGIGHLGLDTYRRLQCSRWAFENAHSAMTGLKVAAWPPTSVRIHVVRLDQAWKGEARCGSITETTVLNDPLE